MARGENGDLYDETGRSISNALVAQFGGASSNTSTETFLASSGNSETSTAVSSTETVGNDFVSTVDGTIDTVAVQHDTDYSTDTVTLTLYVDSTQEYTGTLDGTSGEVEVLDSIGVDVTEGDSLAVSLTGSGTEIGSVSTSVSLL